MFNRPQWTARLVALGALALPAEALAQLAPNAVVLSGSMESLLERLRVGVEYQAHPGEGRHGGHMLGVGVAYRRLVSFTYQSHGVFGSLRYQYELGPLGDFLSLGVYASIDAGMTLQSCSGARHSERDCPGLVLVPGAGVELKFFADRRWVFPVRLWGLTVPLSFGEDTYGWSPFELGFGVGVLL